MADSIGLLLAFVEAYVAYQDSLANDRSDTSGLRGQRGTQSVLINVSNHRESQLNKSDGFNIALMTRWPIPA